MLMPDGDKLVWMVPGEKEDRLRTVFESGKHMKAATFLAFSETLAVNEKSGMGNGGGESCGRV